MPAKSYSLSNKNTRTSQRRDYNQHDIKEDTHRPLAGQNNEPECLVWGSLALMLHICRWFGLAPLRLTPRPDGWIARVSKPFHVYGCCLILGFHAVVLTGLYLDMTAGEEDEIGLTASTSEIVFYVEVVFMFLMNTYAVFTALRRMKDMIAYLNLINEVHIKMTKGRYWQPGERKKKLSAILIVALIIILYTFDWYCFFLESISSGRIGAVKVLLCYIAYYIETTMEYLMELQFVFVGLLIESGFKYINRAMRDLIYIYDFEVKSTKYKLVSGICETAVPVPLPVITNIWRTENANEDRGMTEHRRSEMIAGIRSISSAYSTARDVMIQVNESFGMILLLVVCLSTLYIVVPAYYGFSYLMSPEIPILYVAFDSVFILWYIFMLWLAMEPGHRVETQTQETKVLLGHLLRRVDVQDPLTVDLHYMYKIVMMKQPAFSPLGLTVMTRPLILSIFGAVTTYVLILQQFQALDSKK